MEKERKELEIALTTYIAMEHNQDECSGFIDGFKEAMKLINKDSVLHSIMQSHPVIHIEIEKSIDKHYIKVGRLSNMKYQVWEDQGNGNYNKEGKEWDTLEKALAYSETLT